MGRISLLHVAVGLGPESPYTRRVSRSNSAVAQIFSGKSATNGTPAMTSTLTPPASAPGPDSATNARAVSSFTALTRRVHELNLMRRRYGYYWTKLVGALVILAAWVFAFIWIGDSWWQMINAAVLAIIMAQLGFLGHDAAHRQIFKSGRWNDWTSLVIANLLVGISYGWWRNKHNRHHANPNKIGSDPDVALGVIAMTPEQATRPRSRLMKWLVSHQGWYFFPILMLEGLSLRLEGFRRVVKRGPVERRWAEFSLLMVRLAVLVALVFLVLSPAKAAAFLTVELAVFGFYLGSAFAPNHVGMPLVSPRLKLDFLRRQVLMSRNISGGRFMSMLMGGLNHQIEHHLFPSMARPYLRKVQPLVAAYCAAEGVPYTQMTLWQSYGVIIRYLNSVGLRGRDPFLCPLVAQRRAL
jgi:fatty acid desaturase